MYTLNKIGSKYMKQVYRKKWIPKSIIIVGDFKQLFLLLLEQADKKAAKIQKKWQHNYYA